MDAIATRVFLIETSATPAQVWAALTRPDQTVRYFNGLAIESTWRPGSTVGFGSSDPFGLEGEVLVVQEPRRLSYTLTSGPGQPTTYLTWELDGSAQTTFVRLSVDKPDPSSSRLRRGCRSSTTSSRSSRTRPARSIASKPPGSSATSRSDSAPRRRP